MEAKPTIAVFRHPVGPAIGMAALATLWLVAFTGVTAQAASPSVRIGSGEGAPGASVTVRLEVLAVPGPGLGAFTVDVTYDMDVLAAEGCAEDPEDVLDTVFCNTAFAPGVLRVGGFQLSAGTTGDVALADLTFQVAGSAGECSDLTVDVVELTDSDVQPVTATAVDGAICATGGPVGGVAETGGAGTDDDSSDPEAAATPGSGVDVSALPDTGASGGLGWGWWAAIGAGAAAAFGGALIVARWRLRPSSS